MLTFPHRLILIPTLLLAALASAPPALAQTGADPVDPALIARLIAQLGDEDYFERQSAEEELARIGRPAAAALKEAVESDNAEIAERARRLFSKMLKYTHVVVDATGEPIVGARVEIPMPNGVVVTFLTNTLGDMDIPFPGKRFSYRDARLSHADYGIARVRIRFPGDKKPAPVPLVKRGTPAYERALRGVVTDEQGEPVIDARINCSHVRTVGEGLISGNSATVFTDKQGRFSTYYVGSSQRADERGELIPPGSRYSITVVPPTDSDLFPQAAECVNNENAALRLRRPTRDYVLRFEAIGGGFIEDSNVLNTVSLYYSKTGDSTGVALGRRYIETGGKLLDGFYSARFIASNRWSVKFQRVKVTADSPQELVFKLPPAITYHGRVVHGVTDEPMAGAIVFGYNGTVSGRNLADLSDEDWRQLHQLPGQPDMQDPAVKKITDIFTTVAITRTDEQGRYELRKPQGRELYGLIAVDENFLPVSTRIYKLEVDDDDRADAGDLPLFPAAKIIARPVTGEHRLSVMPRWRFAKENQPDWLARVRKIEGSNERDFQFDSWMRRDTRQPVFVPAGVNLQIMFDAPYDDKWSPTLVPRVFHLEQGDELDLGDVRFLPALPVKVRVNDPQGNPVEGAPVRRMYGGTNHFSVAHNTDAEGKAAFHVNASSTGKFAVTGIPKAGGQGGTEYIETPFKVGEQVEPDKTFTITLTTAQIKRLLGEGDEK